MKFNSQANETRKAELALMQFEKEGFTCKDCKHYPCPTQKDNPDYVKPLCFAYINKKFDW